MENTISENAVVCDSWGSAYIKKDSAGNWVDAGKADDSSQGTKRGGGGCQVRTCGQVASSAARQNAIMHALHDYQIPLSSCPRPIQRLTLATPLLSWAAAASPGPTTSRQTVPSRPAYGRCQCETTSSVRGPTVPCCACLRRFCCCGMPGVPCAVQAPRNRQCMPLLATYPSWHAGNRISNHYNGEALLGGCIRFQSMGPSSSCN